MVHSYVLFSQNKSNYLAHFLVQVEMGCYSWFQVKWPVFGDDTIRIIAQ